MNSPLADKTHPLVRFLIHPISRLSDVGAVLSALIFCAMVFLILAEVILRNFFGSSTEVSAEYSGYALAAMIYLGMGFSFREGAHIRITFLRERLGTTAAYVLEIVCTLFVLVLCSLATAFIWELVVTSRERNLTAYTPAETPLYIPQAIIFIGMLLLSLQIVGQLTALLLGGRKKFAGDHDRGKK